MSGQNLSEAKAALRKMAHLLQERVEVITACPCRGFVRVRVGLDVATLETPPARSSNVSQAPMFVSKVHPLLIARDLRSLISSVKGPNFGRGRDGAEFCHDFQCNMNGFCLSTSTPTDRPW